MHLEGSMHHGRCRAARRIGKRRARVKRRRPVLARVPDEQLVRMRAPVCPCVRACGRGGGCGP